MQKDNNTAEQPQSAEQTTALQPGVISRRAVLAASAGAAAAGCDTLSANSRIDEAEAAARKKEAAPTAPFDTLREYMAALEADGLVLRFDKVDQDEFEGAAIIYALIDKYGWYDAPAVT